MLPGKNALNLGALVAFVALTVCVRRRARSLRLLVAVTVLALLLGWHLVASIGGGDMPVVVSMLNSYSGWAAAASGFLLGQRPADRHRRAGRLLRCVPVLHHVQGDEPLVHLGHRRRLRHRGAVGATTRDYGEHREINAEDAAELLARRDVGGHHARLRHGRRPGAVPGRRPHPPAARHAASTSASASTRSPAACPGT